MYVIMWNLPGCLPEMDPYQTEKFEWAQELLLEDLNFRFDAAEDTDEEQAWQDVIYQVSAASPEHGVSATGPDGYVYKIVLDTP